MNLCGLPKEILNENQENSLLLKKDVADKRIIFYNNYNYFNTQNYSFIKNKNWNNLDFLLSSGDIIENHYKDSHLVYINMQNLVTQKNLLKNKISIQNSITQDIFENYEKSLKCKSCYPYISMDLTKNDSENLNKLFSFLYPKNESKKNTSILSFIRENLYENLSVNLNLNINEKNINNFNTDFAIIKLISDLKNEIRNLKGNNTRFLSAYILRIKIIEHVRQSRNVLLNYANELFNLTTKNIFTKIREIKKNYV